MFFTVETGKITKSFLGKALLVVLTILRPSLAMAQPTIVNETNSVPLQISNLPLAEVPYILGEGDRLKIDIYGVPEYSQETLVLSGGSVVLPLVGRVMVDNLTIEQATEVISAAYAKVFKLPLVSVTLAAPRPVQVTVIGEVSLPGSYSFQLLEPGESLLGFRTPSAIDAIQKAEGMTLTADPRRVELRRRGIGGSAEKIFYLNLWEFLQVGGSTQNMNLRDGDTIFVPALTNINLKEVHQLATTVLARSPEKPRTVMVVGNVKNPGSYVLLGGATSSELRPGGLPTLTLALQRAGGVMPEADVRHIELRRTTKAGFEQIINVDLWQMLQLGDWNLDPILQEKDVIVVSRATEVNLGELNELAGSSFMTENIKVSVVGEIAGRAGGGTLNLPPNTTLNQAVIAAGGFNNRARQSAVTLIRVSPNGTVEKQIINLDFSQGVNAETNPLLTNNDIIVVSTSTIFQITETANQIFQPFPRVVNLLRSLDILGIINSQE